MRPSFPGEVFADILAYAGADGTKRALEIGPGTGKATGPFLEAGYDVTAVEISERMAAFLRARFAGNARFHVLVDAFEEARLAENRYGLVFAASAFHWVDAEIGCPKVHRVLEEGGAFALMRYNATLYPAEGEALHGEMRDAYARHYYSHYPSAGRPVKISHARLETPAKIASGYGFADMRAYGFADVTMKLYDGVLTYSAEAYISHLDTLSDHRSLPEADRLALYAAVRDIIRRHGGQHRVDYVFQLYMGRKA